jgi:hypothetical protein
MWVYFEQDSLRQWSMPSTCQSCLVPGARHHQHVHCFCRLHRARFCCCPRRNHRHSDTTGQSCSRCLAKRHHPRTAWRMCLPTLGLGLSQGLRDGTLSWDCVCVCVCECVCVCISSTWCALLWTVPEWCARAISSVNISSVRCDSTCAHVVPHEWQVVSTTVSIPPTIL